MNCTPRFCREHLWRLSFGNQGGGQRSGSARFLSPRRRLFCPVVPRSAASPPTAPPHHRAPRAPSSSPLLRAAAHGLPSTAAATLIPRIGPVFRLRPSSARRAPLPSCAFTAARGHLPAAPPPTAPWISTLRSLANRPRPQLAGGAGTSCEEWEVGDRVRSPTHRLRRRRRPSPSCPQGLVSSHHPSHAVDRNQSRPHPSCAYFAAPYTGRLLRSPRGC